jgi:hypothetical protein
MPSQFREESLSGFVATPTRGGFIRVGRSSATGDEAGNSLGTGGAFGAGNTAGGGEANGQPEPNQMPISHDGQQVSGPTQGNPSARADGGQPSPIATARGKDWGLPKASAHATGITRPIRVACLADQLVILPEEDDRRPPRVIGVSHNMTDSIDDFVSAIWEHMEQWGIAVAGGYWKPILRVEVGHGAEARFQELHVLLQDSGIDVTRKSP